MRGATVYAKLMDRALQQPRDDLRNDVERILRGSGIDALLERLIEQLNKAYVAGVADGYADRVIEEERELS